MSWDGKGITRKVQNFHESDELLRYASGSLLRYASGSCSSETVACRPPYESGPTVDRNCNPRGQPQQKQCKRLMASYLRRKFVLAISAYFGALSSFNQAEQ